MTVTKVIETSGRKCLATPRGRTHRKLIKAGQRSPLPAWAIFRRTCNFPQIKFSDIGRKCFAWALRQAWVEARQAARLAALSPVIKAERIETLHALIDRAGYIDRGRSGRRPSAP